MIFSTGQYRTMFLDVVVGKIWFALKGFVALVAFVSGILVAFGIECGVDSSILQIIIGVGMILAAIFVMADFGGMKQALDRLNSENDRLASNNETLEQSLNRQKAQLDESEKQIGRREKQIRTASRQLDERSEQIAQQAIQIGNLENINVALEGQVDGFAQERAKFAREREALEETVFGLKITAGESARQVVELTDAVQVHKENIRTLEGYAKKVEAQIRERDEQIAESKSVVTRMESALSKQKIIQDNANKLIQSLMNAGDDFKDFKDVIKDSLDRIDNTADMLDVLATRMTDGKFSEMDADGDGVIDEGEMQAWIAKQAGHE